MLMRGFVTRNRRIVFLASGCLPQLRATTKPLFVQHCQIMLEITSFDRLRFKERLRLRLRLQLKSFELVKAFSRYM